MNPLSGLYGAVVRARNDLYDRGTLPARRLQGPVVSVGNIAVGGSGKTPFLIALGELLKQRGISFDVLSRGYRRSTEGVALVDPKGSPEEFGDEPLLIARKMQVPVVVGENRYLAGQFAEKQFGPRLHLLDDGFQHRALARDFDIVMIAPGDAGDSLLPVGRLREPLSSLERAHAIVLTNDASQAGLPVTHQHLWRVGRNIVPPQVSGPCMAFCGIARPKSFFAELCAAGVNLVATRSFRDHHRYTGSDIRGLLEMRAQSGATTFLTTEKDAVNLQGEVEALAPLHTVAVQMRIDNAEAVVNAVMAAVGPRASSA